MCGHCIICSMHVTYTHIIIVLFHYIVIMTCLCRLQVLAYVCMSLACVCVFFNRSAAHLAYTRGDMSYIRMFTIEWPARGIKTVTQITYNIVILYSDMYGVEINYIIIISVALRLESYLINIKKIIWNIAWFNKKNIMFQNNIIQTFYSNST